MRATLADLKHHPTWFGEWWLELPLRRRSFWRALLTDPGEGWLCWGIYHGYRGGWDGEPPEELMFAPPVRRLWMGFRGLLFTVRVKLFNTDGLRRDYAGWVNPWHDTEYLRNPDRKRELWRR